MSQIAPLLDAALQMPTLVWTVLLGVVALYWSLSLLGLFNLEMLEGVDAAADGVLDGFADAAADGAAEALDTVADAAGAGDADPGFFGKFGFGDVPRSITWSLTVLFTWGVSLLGSVYLPGFREIATRSMVMTAMISVASMGVALVATAVAIQPLRKLILAGYGRTRDDLVGETCVVTTQTVTEEFGQAESADGGAILQVRNRGGQTFHRGMRALIFEYDSKAEVFYITPFDSDNSTLPASTNGAVEES